MCWWPHRSGAQLAVRGERGLASANLGLVTRWASLWGVRRPVVIGLSKLGIASWTDEAVLALANLKIPKEQADRMSVLLERLDEGRITDAEERELEVYTELSQIATLRKAYGIAEAVKRKLISSPADLK